MRAPDSAPVPASLHGEWRALVEEVCGLLAGDGAASGGVGDTLVWVRAIGAVMNVGTGCVVEDADVCDWLRGLVAREE